MTELVLKDEVYAIVGAAIDVHKELGPGFNEAVYQEALEIEFGLREIPYESQKNLKIRYKDHILERDYFADVVCYGKIIVELKALDNLTSKEEAQILHYLKASEMKVGLLINFGSRAKLEWKRFVY